MYNQADAVLDQYEIEIKQLTKERNGYSITTENGNYLLVPWKGSKERGQWLKEYLKMIHPYFPVEQILTNKEDAVVSEDGVTGEKFIVKEEIRGTELGPTRLGEVLEAVRVLGEYHNAAEVSGAVLPEGHRKPDVVEGRRRHYRELVKVYKYIRNRKKKMEFERLYMSYYSEMEEAAARSIGVLEEQEKANPRCLICHGDCNQHHMVWTERGWRMIHFETATESWGIWDLANFMRKILEKNGWDEELGMEMLRNYDSVRPLRKEEFMELYGILLFPEKFWKLANHYMGTGKIWIPEKDTEKMMKVVQQEKLRLNFVENLFSFEK